MQRCHWRDLLVVDKGVAPPVHKARRREWDRIRHVRNHEKYNRRQYFRSVACGLIQSPRPETLLRYRILRLQSGEYVLQENAEQPQQEPNQQPVAISQGVRSVTQREVIQEDKGKDAA